MAEGHCLAAVADASFVDGITCLVVKEDADAVVAPVDYCLNDDLKPARIDCPGAEANRETVLLFRRRAADY